MPLADTRCTHCGAELRVNGLDEVMICDHCGSKFFNDQAITNNNLTVNNKFFNVVNGGYGFQIRSGELIKYDGTSADVVIPEGVTIIGERAFADCHGLKSVRMPDTVTSIGARAFENCTNLEQIELPYNMNFIGKGAFAFCKSLRSICIPRHVEEIGDRMFEGCELLEELWIHDNVIINVDFYDSMSPFIGCRNLNIVSTDKWKRKNWDRHPSLAPYKPQTETIAACYVATCVYGKYDCPQVWVLRRFRDQVLAQTWYGRAFIHTYYAVSPKIVKRFGDSGWFKKMWKGRLDKMVVKLQEKGFEDTPYNDMKW